MEIGGQKLEDRSWRKAGMSVDVAFRGWGRERGEKLIVR